MPEERNDNEFVIDLVPAMFLPTLVFAWSAMIDLKLAIAREISRIIVRDGLTQLQLARLLRTDLAKVSSMVRGRLKGFSVVSAEQVHA